MELDWLDLEYGSQRLFYRVIERPNALVLEGETLLYLDRQRAEFGVLDADAELPKLLATAPALLLEHTYPCARSMSVWGGDAEGGRLLEPERRQACFATGAAKSRSQTETQAGTVKPRAGQQEK
ncbi:hypothetical protein [Aquimonas sp.]|uniref:hypothetical protein n=1 Tax=Aquimonas sp. TaxID=1872588 RepID=UPI0037C01DC3